MIKAKHNTGTFSYFDALLEGHGFTGVPVVHGTKRPAVKRWEKLATLTSKEREALRQKLSGESIGVLAGTKLESGRRFGFIDVDVDGLVPFVRAVMSPVISGKVGQKGLTIFCEIEPEIRSGKWRLPGSSTPSVEIFADTGQSVIPPSKHPSGTHYQWVGEPFFEVSNKLPVLDSVRLAILRKVVENKYTAEILSQGASVKGHDLMLRLTSSGVALLTEDLAWLAECLNYVFHPDYSGNTKEQTLEMLTSARDKNLGTINSPSRYKVENIGPIPLGYTRDGLYTFRDQVRNIIITASANQLLSYQYLLGLAPSKFWAKQFPNEKGMFNFMGAGEVLIAACKHVGPFDPAKVRGRGVWLEGEQIIINLGEPILPNTKYHYLCFDPIGFEGTAQFDTSRLLNYLQRFNWRDPQDAILLLGWLALAPICGSLNWRPHCFLYGPPRCGKTTIHTLAARLLYPLGISTDGQSSEAGIRQKLGPDSLPVIIDEFESDQHGSSLRGVLRLARSASSAENAVLRGTPEGKAMQFSLRTSFFFSAVTPGRMSPADQSRIILLEMLKHDGNESVARELIAEEAYFRDLGPAWCNRMISLAGLMKPALTEFELTVPSADRRHRQNLATLLAAAFIALHGRIPSAEEAAEWSIKYRSTVIRHEQDIERDSSREALDHLLAYVVDKYPLSQWIALALVPLGDNDPHYLEVQRIMRMFDFVRHNSADQPGVLIRNGSPKIEEVFRNTIWEGRGWERALRALEGAFTVANPVYFGGAGRKSRCIGIPAEYIPDPIEMRTSGEGHNDDKEY